MDEKVFKYLREHPELENTSRYSEFRFWRQVTTGSTPGEVKVLLGEPRERTIDPALMASLGKAVGPSRDRPLAGLAQQDGRCSRWSPGARSWELAVARGVLQLRVLRGGT